MAESRRQQNLERKEAATSGTVRRSKPRKVEPVDDDTPEAGRGLHLASYFVGGVAILLGMIIIATFLASPPVNMVLVYAFLGAAVVTAALYLLGSLQTKRAQA